MKSKVLSFTILVVLVSLTTVIASADVVSTSGMTVITPPASVARNVLESNETMFLFTESLNVTLETDLIVDISSPGSYGDPDGGTIAAGACVNSYFIHYDLVSGNFFTEASATFEEEILGVITSNLNLDASDWLGAPGTFYGNSVLDGEVWRGAELQHPTDIDYLTLSADRRTVSLLFIVVPNWQDQIRVITQGNCEPEEPDVLEVQIDVKPNSDPSCFNSNGKGRIPVAILGSADFDVRLIDVASLELDGAPVSPRKNNPNKLRAGYEDYNFDGFEDLIVKFVDTDNYDPGDEWAVLTGTLLDGTPIMGIGDICIRPGN